MRVTICKIPFLLSAKSKQSEDYIFALCFQNVDLVKPHSLVIINVAHQTTPRQIYGVFEIHASYIINHPALGRCAEMFII